MTKHKIVEKKWGSEEWITNRDYCGKKLILNKGFRCSMHHHKNKDDKEIEISLAAAKGWGKKRIQKEIDKCSILCSNCHRDLHYQERNASIVSAA